MNENKFKLTFCGGVGSVTGANFLFEGPTSDGKSFKLLVDCGVEQGTSVAEEKNRKDFIYNPAEIDALFVTHAHMDHIGKIPKLVKDGFKGVIYSTPETAKLIPLMLEDELKLITQEAVRAGKDPIFEEQDVKDSLSLLENIPYHVSKEVFPGITVYLKDAGHVLGSSMYEFSYKNEKGEDRKIVFTGDLGNSPTPLLKDTEDITDADYIVMESVYGDRNHETGEDRINLLEDTIEEVIKKKGVLILPCFSLEKTQEIIYELNKLVEGKKISPIPVYIDSPLAIKITGVYKSMTKDFNDNARADMAKGDDIFNFPNLHFTDSSEESKAIRNAPQPKIIIAGSGMSNGGRIIHHEINYLGDPNSVLLLVGYQSVGTLGRQIQDGAKTVEINGEQINIKAKIEHIDGYSSHKDSDHLIEFVEKDADKAKKVFVVMGETKSSLFLVQRLRDYLGVNAHHPEEGESVLLD